MRFSTAGRKRPRRSVATSVKSYVVPDSDDEQIVVDGEDESLQRFAKKRRQESNMQRWIKQLAVLYKEEQRKVRSISFLWPSYIRNRPWCRRCSLGSSML